MLIKNKSNKLFNLILSEIHELVTIQIIRTSRISINKLYLYKFNIKYKKCCDSYIVVQINSVNVLTFEKIKKRLSKKYYNYLNIFNRFKADALLSYRLYNYKLKFVKRIDKTKLSRSRIYSILDQKLKEVKKYLNEYLKKRFIVLSYTLFASLILFTKKLNKGLRFYINYRKLNQITKRN